MHNLNYNQKTVVVSAIAAMVLAFNLFFFFIFTPYSECQEKDEKMPTELFNFEYHFPYGCFLIVNEDA